MKVEFGTYQLKENETAHPITCVDILDIDLPLVTKEMLVYIFKDKKHKLKTWGNNVGTFKPHFIAVQKQTPLHTDKGYNKFTHHLVLYCDDTFVLRGLDKQEIKPIKGMYFVLDGHSPHQLLAKNKNEGFYLSASIDSNKIMDKEHVLKTLFDFINSTNVTNNCHVKNL